jgi:hypothetical protein
MALINLSGETPNTTPTFEAVYMYGYRWGLDKVRGLTYEQLSLYKPFLPDMVPHMADTNKTLKNGVYLPTSRLILGVNVLIPRPMTRGARTTFNVDITNSDAC